MIHVDNKKTIYKVADASFRADKMRNLFAVTAIVLTTILFSGLFTIAGSLMASMEESTMRQVGGNAHGGFKYLTMEQYEKLKRHPDIKEISYTVVLGIAENRELLKRPAEIRYAKDALAAEMMFSMPTTGKMPEKRDEIATDTLVLERLGITPRLGEQVTLEYSVCGEKKKETFTLVGFWEGDIIMSASQVWLSQDYVEEILGNFGTAEKYVGTINADVNFGNSRNIETKLLRVIEESGYTKEDIEYGVNWAYVGGDSMDLTTILGVILVLTMIAFCGYLMISNVFLISVTKDVHFYGLLKTIGTTGKQIKILLKRQALHISFIGIPLGVIMGTFIGGMLTPYVLGILNLNVVKVYSPWWVYAFAAAFSFFTVFVSIRKATKQAAAVSPMEALHMIDGNGREKREYKQTTKISLWRMAWENVGRNRKKAVLVTGSLSLSLMVLNTGYTMANSFDLDKYLDRMISSDFVMGDVSWFNVYSGYTNQDTLSDEFLKTLSSYQGIEAMEKIYFTEKKCELDEHWDTMAERAMEEVGLSGDWLKHMEEEIASGSGMYHVYGVDDGVWEKFTVWKGEINLEKLHGGNYVVAAPYDSEGKLSAYKVGDYVDIFTQDGKDRRCEVIAIASIPYNISVQHSHPVDINFYLPSEVFLNTVEQKAPMAVTLDVADSGITAIEQFLADYCENQDHSMQYSSKAVYVEEYKNTQRTYKMVGIVVSVLLAFIGIANFANTIITSVMTRKRELAMLESIGMTGKQQRNMLIMEGLIFMLWTAVITCTLGTLFGKIALQMILGESAYFTIKYTVIPSLVCMPFFLGLAVLIPVLSRKYINRESIVERLRRGE